MQLFYSFKLNYKKYKTHYKNNKYINILFAGIYQLNLEYWKDRLYLPFDTWIQTLSYFMHYERPSNVCMLCMNK